MIDKWGLADWETPFVMLDGDRIIGMVTVAKTDYYPLPDVHPWVSGVFVSEEYRGHRLSGQMIDFANAYLDKRMEWLLTRNLSWSVNTVATAPIRNLFFTNILITRKQGEDRQKALPAFLAVINYHPVSLPVMIIDSGY